ncbi:hypothetical protein EUGRSUZ_F04080 [Eucalyptus grandis]|uniref:Uncharacterized protein n=2 Tax=Eucalyptus grandis TaxID=71139 RepID=A0ACC3KNI4_EUCGR|nr:hypothetical protein EUGRSUZ_F04080 [Eucalyptus grandis]
MGTRYIDSAWACKAMRTGQLSRIFMMDTVEQLTTSAILGHIVSQCKHYLFTVDFPLKCKAGQLMRQGQESSSSCHKQCPFDKSPIQEILLEEEGDGN